MESYYSTRHRHQYLFAIILLSLFVPRAMWPSLFLNQVTTWVFKWNFSCDICVIQVLCKNLMSFVLCKHCQSMFYPNIFCLRKKDILLGHVFYVLIEAGCWVFFSEGQNFVIFKITRNVLRSCLIKKVKAVKFFWWGFNYFYSL